MREPAPARGAIGEVVAIDLSVLYPDGIVTWQDAETLGLSLMRYLGYADAVLTRAGSDSGIDVDSRDACCQVKHWSTSVGRQELQRLAGAATGRRPIFLARAYSAPAISWSTAGNVALFTYAASGVVTAANALATVLATRSGSDGMSDREATIAARNERVGRWLGIVSTHIDRSSAARAPGWSRREVRHATKTARASFANARRANSALDAAAERGGIEDVERALAKLEFELRRAAVALRVHLPD